MVKAESNRSKLIEFIFFIAVVGCIILALVEIGSNLIVEMEVERDPATLTLPPD